MWLWKLYASAACVCVWIVREELVTLLGIPPLELGESKRGETQYWHKDRKPHARQTIATWLMIYLAVMGYCQLYWSEHLRLLAEQDAVASRGEPAWCLPTEQWQDADSLRAMRLRSRALEAEYTVWQRVQHTVWPEMQAEACRDYLLKMNEHYTWPNPFFVLAQYEIMSWMVYVEVFGHAIGRIGWYALAVLSTAVPVVLMGAWLWSLLAPWLLAVLREYWPTSSKKQQQLIVYPSIDT